MVFLYFSWIGLSCEILVLNDAYLMGNELLYLCSTASALKNLCLKFTTHFVTVTPSVMCYHQ